jgi:hypothetical protein
MRRRALLWWFALGWAGCGGAANDPASAADVDDVANEPVAQAPRNAGALAVKAVGAKLTALIHVERLRSHPLAPQVAGMEAFGPVFDGTGIDPLEDVDRAFVAAANARDEKAVVAVAEHHVEPERINKALDTLVARSDGEGARLHTFGFPAALIVVKKRKSVVLAVTPTLLVVTSEAYASAASSLKDAGGLPEPTGPEALVADAEQPSTTLEARRAPAIPKTISHAHATVVLGDDGGADVAIVGDSSDPEQAKQDAADLTKAIEDATTVKISIIKVRAFEPVAFEADGSQVKAQRHVTQAEMQTLLGFAKMLSK